MNRLLLLVILAIPCLACNSEKKTEKGTAATEKDMAQVQKHSQQELDGYATAYFASGCFWCVEAIFESVRGVKEVVSGYAGGTEANPTYEEVGAGQTHHAESVKIYYDPSEISFLELVQVFFGSHDPTTLNRQGPDRGAQYRSIAFYQNEQEKKTIESYIRALEDKKVYDRPIVTEVTKFTTFYEAEDYHQDYEKRNPNNPYVQNVSLPRLNRFKQNFPEYLKAGVH